MDRHTRHATGGSFPASLQWGVGWTVRSQARLAHSRRAACGLEKACGWNVDYGYLGLAYGDRGHVDRLPLVPCRAACGRRGGPDTLPAQLLAREPGPGCLAQSWHGVEGACGLDVADSGNGCGLRSVEIWSAALGDTRGSKSDDRAVHTSLHRRGHSRTLRRVHHEGRAATLGEDCIGRGGDFERKKVC